MKVKVSASDLRRMGVVDPDAAPVELGELADALDAAVAENVVAAKTVKIYLSGPMKGFPDSNYPLFNKVAAELRATGAEVYNPAEFPHNGPRSTFPLRRAFAEYSSYICNEADMIVLLPGWENSKGVRAELALAQNCGLVVLRYGDYS